MKYSVVFSLHGSKKKTIDVLTARSEKELEFKLRRQWGPIKIRSIRVVTEGK